MGKQRIKTRIKFDVEPKVVINLTKVKAFLRAFVTSLSRCFQ